ncbi:MAG: hypothetical protein RLZZ519_3467 [Bacteroidota bacterium]|jgi:hypothetical protein
MPNWTDGEDIDIGEGKVIQWIDWDSDNAEAYDVDDLLDPNNEFWSGLETVCLPECCGLYAFDWTTDGIKIASTKSDVDEFKRTLDAAIHALEQRDEKVVCFSRLNQLFERTVFINLLQHLKSSV